MSAKPKHLQKRCRERALNNKVGIALDFASVFPIVVDPVAIKVSVLARHLEAAGVDGEDGVHQQMRWTPWNTSSAHHGGRTVRN